MVQETLIIQQVESKKDWTVYLSCRTNFFSLQNYFLSLLVADDLHLSSMCAFFLAPVAQEVWLQFIPMLFASKEHGLCSHTTRFAFLSHKPSCASRVDPTLLSSGYLGAHQGGQAICWARVLWDHRVTCNLLLRQRQHHLCK